MARGVQQSASRSSSDSLNNSPSDHLHLQDSLSFSLLSFLQNENRYNVGKGTHLVLKRAEKARSLVSKMPGNMAFVLLQPWRF